MSQRFRFNLRTGAALLLCAAFALFQTACDGCGGSVKSIRPSISVAPEAISFGEVPVGSSAEQFVNVTNTGRGLLTVTGITVDDETSIAVPDTRIFVSNCDDTPRKSESPMTLGPSECARFAVRFAPQASQSYATTIRVTSNDAERETVEIPVTGAGTIGTIKVCVLDAAGEEHEEECSILNETPPFIPVLDFGPVLYGEHTIRTVRVYNEGTGLLVLHDVHVESEVPDFTVHELPEIPLTVKAGESADLQVAILPDGNRNVTGELILGSNDQAHSRLAIPLAAEEEGPCLTVDPGSTMDFGVVSVGDQRSLSLKLENCGHVTYDLTTFEFKPDLPTSTVFTLPGGDPTAPLTLAPGDTKTVEVVYKPTANHLASEPGDAGTFSIRTSYGARYAVRVLGRGSQTCFGKAPTGKIRVLRRNTTTPVTGTVVPLTTVDIDGSTSAAATGTTLFKYDWQLVSAPQNSTSKVSTASVDKFPFFLDIAGDYVVSLTVSARDSGGTACQSTPVQATITVKPPDGVHIELTWPESYGDLDIHYVGPGGALYQKPTGTPKGDIYWTYSKQTMQGTTVVGNGTRPAPDWGQGNQVLPDGNPNNDARIDVDQIWGKGPENVNHDHPFDGTYTIMAHTFCNRTCSAFSCGSSLGAINAKIRVYIDGVLKFDASQALRQRDVWEAATVTVAGSNVTVTPLSKPLYKITSSGTQACSSAGD